MENLYACDIACDIPRDCSCRKCLEDVEPIKDTSNWLLDNRVKNKTNVTTCLGVEYTDEHLT